MEKLYYFVNKDFASEIEENLLQHVDIVFPQTVSVRSDVVHSDTVVYLCLLTFSGGAEIEQWHEMCCVAKFQWNIICEYFS